MMRKVLVTLAFGGLAFALACGDTSGPRSGLNIVSGAGVSDTVLATFKPPLTVQLLDGNLQPLSGQTVYFNTNGFVLVAPIHDPGFVINRLPVITDASGQAAVWVEAKQYAATGKVVIVAPSGQSVDLYFTVLPGAPALVRADPGDTALYVGGSETFRPFVTDAYGNRLPVAPTYQYQSLSTALSVSAPGKATGVAIGRGSVSVSAMGFTDTVWASVVPKGRIAIQGAYIVATNLDGSVFDTIPSPWRGGRTLDWSQVNSTFVYDVDASDYRNLISQDTTGHAHPVVTDPLMRNEYYPRYAHDGSYIYFTGIDSLTTCWGVWRVHPDGTALEHMVADTLDCGPYAYQSGPAPNYASSPSPDGTRLVYVGGRNIPYVGGILRVRTFATRADTSLGATGIFPRWSPTGEWIAYDSLGTLTLIHPDGTGHQALLYRGDRFNPAISWSPDGQWLVYTGFEYYPCPDRPACFTGLKIVQVATGLKLRLPYAAGLTDPTWQR
jgi:Tol biopolymer transport system component